MSDFINQHIKQFYRRHKLFVVKKNQSSVADPDSLRSCFWYFDKSRSSFSESGTSPDPDSDQRLYGKQLGKLYCWKEFWSTWIPPPPFFRDHFGRIPNLVWIRIHSPNWVRSILRIRNTAVRQTRPQSTVELFKSIHVSIAMRLF